MQAQASLATKPSLTLKRRLDAPPQKVYAAWTDAEKILNWFGPDSGPVAEAVTDVRVGGRYAVTFSTEDGEEHHVSGVYREVVPNQKLVFTWAWRTMPARESLEDEEALIMRNTGAVVLDGDPHVAERLAVAVGFRHRDRPDQARRHRLDPDPDPRAVLRRARARSPRARLDRLPRRTRTLFGVTVKQEKSHGANGSTST